MSSLSLSPLQQLLLLAAVGLQLLFLCKFAAIWHRNTPLLTTALPTLLVSMALLNSTSLCSLSCVFAITYESDFFFFSTDLKA